MTLEETAARFVVDFTGADIDPTGRRAAMTLIKDQLAIQIGAAQLTCREISGEDAEQTGLVSLSVAEEDLLPTAREIAGQLSEGAQEALRWTKYSLNQWYRQHGPIFDASLGLEFLGFGGQDVVEGVTSHRERRAPSFSGVVTS